MEALQRMSRLRLRRLAIGWPQWRLARASGVSVSKLSFSERGLVGVLSPAGRRRLAAALDCDEHMLFPHIEGIGGAADRRVPVLTDQTSTGAARPDGPDPKGEGDA